MLTLPDLEPGPLALRKAAMRDVEGMLSLINYWAERGAMLRKTPELLYPQIRDFYLLETLDGAVVGVVGMHIFWHDLAEVRSLAIHPSFQGGGLGKRLVLGLEPEAHELGVSRLFAWTLEPEFFEHCGYTHITTDELPPKVWKEYEKAAMLKVIG